MPRERRASLATRQEPKLEAIDSGAAMLNLEDEDADLLSQVASCPLGAACSAAPEVEAVLQSTDRLAGSFK